MSDFSCNSDPLLDPLFARARSARPETSRAEYSFETRLLAKLREQQPMARSGFGALPWRLLPFFTLVVFAFGVFDYEAGVSSAEAEQAATLQNPEAVELFSSLE